MTTQIDEELKVISTGSGELDKKMGGAKVCVERAPT